MGIDERDRLDRLENISAAGDGKDRKGKGYTILFVSHGTKKVRSIGISKAGLILIVIVCGMFLAGLTGFILKEVSVRKQYEEKIAVLNEEISDLSGNGDLLQQ